MGIFCSADNQLARMYARRALEFIDSHSITRPIQECAAPSRGSWEVVDSRENNGDLNDYFMTRNFAISAPPSGAFRFVRLRQTGKNHSGDDCLAFQALELFGELSVA